MMPAWDVLSSEYLLQTPYVNLRRDVCLLPSGATIPDYYVIEEPDYGMVFALTDDNLVVMVRQYKHGIGQVVLELPAGYIDARDADPAAGCLREFQEETGYSVRESFLLGAHMRHPSRLNNRGYMLVATGAQPAGNQHLDPAEQIEVVLLPLQTVFDKIRSGEIQAVQTIATVYVGWDFLQRR
ncbi:MAG: NUDIX hydrolase [Phototrophicaceae bacterium]|jgi:8-oxo-dGTP pyrophosphatase MutT (NUDIX family)